MRVRAVLAITAFVAATSPDLDAIITPLTRADMERATALARWPRSDADRSRFHAPYVIRLTGVAADVITVTTIEVITEFRRLELIAEDHARANDNFARGGLRDAEEAIRPFQGVVAIVARLDINAGNRYIAGVPAVDIAVGDRNPMAPTNTRVTGVYASEGGLIGSTVEATFDAASLRHRRAPVVLSFKGVRLTRVVIDFAQLD